MLETTNRASDEPGDPQVSVSLISQNRPVELNTLTPDQLLDLMAVEEDPTK